MEGEKDDRLHIVEHEEVNRNAYSEEIQDSMAFL